MGPIVLVCRWKANSSKELYDMLAAATVLSNCGRYSARARVTAIPVVITVEVKFTINVTVGPNADVETLSNGFPGSGFS
jgi:hypothetical protein